jgi:hypothetical protein
MRHSKYLLLLGLLVIPAALAHAQVSFGVGVQIGPDYGYYNAPPACPYGYYPDYPFGCAPYGYWGPEWFVDGAFIGAGPWYHFYYTHPEIYRRYYARPYYRDYDRGYWARGYRDWDHDRYRRDHDRDWNRGFRGEAFHDHGFRDGGRFDRDGDRGFHGGNGSRGGDRGFHGNEFHGGGHGEFHGGGDRGDHGDRGNHGGGREEHDHGRR